ncbi:phage/plasmid primase, P4 family [Rhodococcus sp. NPDC060090]|uniref:phage/plasmid primase, P4 family n=1 Tax=Rhodococcus sp. NPDC060090 TaxID=3347056 RepID=UPI003646D12C
MTDTTISSSALHPESVNTASEDPEASNARQPLRIDSGLTAPDLTLLDAANLLSEGGFHVLPTTSIPTQSAPAKNASKNPGGLLGKSWQTKTSRDPEKLRNWFTEQRTGTHTLGDIELRADVYREVPFHTVGLAVHAGPRAVIIDIDTPEHVPDHIWAELDTAPYQSSSSTDPRRGHYYFEILPGRRFGHTSAIPVSDGMTGSPGEIRHGTAIAVSAPSIHEKHAIGRRYQWQRTGIVPVMSAQLADWLASKTETADWQGHNIAVTEATLDSIEAFRDTCTAASHPELLDEHLDHMVEQANTRGLHPAWLPGLIDLMKYALCGFVSAAEAMDRAGDAFVALRTDPSRAALGCNVRDEESATQEYIDLLKWALGKVHAKLDTDRAAIEAETYTNAHRFYGVPMRPTAAAASVSTPTEGSRTKTSSGAPLEDAHVAQRIADEHLHGTYCWASGHGWMRYDGKRWQPAPDATVTEDVRKAVIELQQREALAGADVHRMRQVAGLLAANRIGAVVRLARGILHVDNNVFDQHPDLLNCANGVVDLRTGILQPHDPALRLTKLTNVPYTPGATHPDWDTALEALPADSRPWMQYRFGQATTGHPTPDDVMPVLQGGGENGKSTLLVAVERALGEYATKVPERVLLANPSDHPTELMTLRGARLAIIEETPEARRLNVARLKATVGTDTMTARLIAKDSVTWSVTHSLMLATNYVPRVDETDHGTWRRLALVRFPYRYRKPGQALTSPDDRAGDPTLRERLKRGTGGRAEAVLAWLIAGAHTYYSDGEKLPLAPTTVEADTHEWRASTDVILKFVEEKLIFDRDGFVSSADLFAVFNAWMTDNGHAEWSDQTFVARLSDHSSLADSGVTKRRTTKTEGLSRPGWPLPPPRGRYTAWIGFRFRTSTDETSD